MPDGICGDTWSLAASFVSAVSWRLPSCVDFNTVSFGSWKWRGRINCFLFIKGMFGITKKLVIPVLTVALCEYGGY